MGPYAAVLLGPPGTGKSEMASSICDVVGADKTLLIVAKPGEEKSAGYVRNDLDAELYFDMGWLPGLDRFKAGSYTKLLQRLVDLFEDDTYDAIIIDPGTDVINMVEHEILEPSGVGSFGELKDTMGAYRQLGDMAQEFLQTAALLSTKLVKRPKWVIVTWHVQPAKEGQYSKDGKQSSADEKGAGIEYEGAVLPMLEGRYRRKLAGDVDIVVYCDLEIKRDLRARTEEVEYFVQVAPNKERHAKVRGSPVLAGKIPNNMAALIAAMEAANVRD